MLGYVVMAGKGEGDVILHSVARTLSSDGLRVAGAVQVNTERGEGLKCHMDLHILSSDAHLRISQNLGRDARGCRLDPGGLEQAVARVEADLGQMSPNLLIVNKFGKQEVDGRGFRSVIAHALELGVPVLTGVGQGVLTAFEDFADGFGEELPLERDALTAWCRSAIATPAS